MLPGAEEVAPGLQRWVAFHPSWKREVVCVALDAGDYLVLVDPLAPSDPRAARRFWSALDDAVRARGHVDVLLTLHYHLRHAPEVVARYRRRPGVELWAPAASVPRLRVTVDRAFAPGDPLPGGIEALASGREDEVVLWLPSARALVSGDVLLGGVRKPFRVCPQSWLPTGVTRADVARVLRPLLDLPLDMLVPLHGPPVREGARAALAAALEEAERAV